MKLTFIQTAFFVAKWRRLGLTDEDLQALEAEIMERPNAGVVMRGGGGVRKMRFAPPSWNTGKSGATRVCYIVFAEAAHCYLFSLFPKNEQPNLSAAELVELRGLVTSIRRRLERTGQ